MCLSTDRDQKEVAIRAVARRAGVMVSASLSAKSIARAIERALRDQELRNGAKRLADAFAADDTTAAINELQAAVAEPSRSV